MTLTVDYAALQAAIPQGAIIKVIPGTGVDDWTHVTLMALAKSKNDALAAIEAAMKLIADRKRTLSRRAPSSWTVRLFEENRDEHRGYARFTFKDEPGEWTVMGKPEFPGTAA